MFSKDLKKTQKSKQDREFFLKEFRK